MLMYNPPHPGEILKTLCLEPLNLTVTDAAKALGVSRKTLSSILNGRIRRATSWRIECNSFISRKYINVCPIGPEAKKEFCPKGTIVFHLSSRQMEISKNVCVCLRPFAAN